MYITPFQGSTLARVFDTYVAFLDDTGLADVVGGRDELRRGLGELLAGALPLAAELLQAEARGTDLADVVLDPDGAPHAASVHGFIENLLSMNVPTELQEWATKLFTMPPPPSVEVMRRDVVVAALHDANPMARALARFIVFEAICVTQRLRLRADETRLELLFAKRGTVEVTAETEVKILEEVGDYRDEVLEAEDPLGILQLTGETFLDKQLQVLRDELATMQRFANKRLERRQEILRLADWLDAPDRVIWLNETAGELGEQRLAAHQLRSMNPGHLREVTVSAIHKRKERLPAKIKRLAELPPERRTTFADVILDAARNYEVV